MRVVTSLFLIAITGPQAPAGEEFVVHYTDIVDRKAVIATPNSQTNATQL